MSKQTNVSACADTFAEIETGMEAMKVLIDRLHRQIGDAYDSGVGNRSEALRIRNGLEAVRGKVSGTLEKTLEIHAHCTKIAKREGVDVPPNLAIDGGITIMGGGDR